MVGNRGSGRTEERQPGVDGAVLHEGVVVSSVESASLDEQLGVGATVRRHEPCAHPGLCAHQPPQVRPDTLREVPHGVGESLPLIVRQAVDLVDEGLEVPAEHAGEPFREGRGPGGGEHRAHLLLRVEPGAELGARLVGRTDGPSRASVLEAVDGCSDHVEGLSLDEGGGDAHIEHRAVGRRKGKMGGAPEVPAEHHAAGEQLGQRGGEGVDGDSLGTFEGPLGDSGGGHPDARNDVAAGELGSRCVERLGQVEQPVAGQRVRSGDEGEIPARGLRGTEVSGLSARGRPHVQHSHTVAITDGGAGGLGRLRRQ